jgi:hypothetical protein
MENRSGEDNGRASVIYILNKSPGFKVVLTASLYSTSRQSPIIYIRVL